MGSPVPFVNLPAEYLEIKGEVDAVVAKVVETGMFIQGPEVEALERELAAFVGVPHSVTCNSGTDALLLALMALGIKPGDEVVTTPFSFFATASMVAFLGAVPVWADIDPATFNLTPERAEAAITPRTRALLPVSLYGQPCDLEGFRELGRRRGLPVIEDGAQSFGARFGDLASGGATTIGTTSFFPTKTLGTFGDGGALFTADESLAKKLRVLMNQGQVKRYEHQRVGINGRLDALKAAVLRVKLRHFPKWLARRSAIGARYTDLLAGVKAILPHHAPGRTHVYAQYTIRVQNRDAVAKALGEKGVPTAVHYPGTLYAQEALRSFAPPAGACPEAEKAAREVLSLPMSAQLTDAQQDQVVKALHEVLG